MSRYKNSHVPKLEPKQEHCSNDCVCDVVRKVINAQDEVAGNNDYCNGCDSSIHQLRRGKTNREPINTTIPLILYCEGSCEPFIGTGVFQASRYDCEGSFFGNVETPIFRAKHFVKDRKCCVKLELLLPVTDCDVLMRKTEDNYSAISHYFPADDPVTDFQATGICITVDLNKFIGVTCLDPIAPLPANEFHYA